MKKVLIITYYWPPAGGPGVRRIVKFVKYLPLFGWEPIILTVKNGEFPTRDESLAAEIPSNIKVIKTASLEPGSLYKWFTGQKQDAPIPVAAVAESGGNWKKRLSRWVRLHLFIPDAKIGWIPFALSAGKKCIKQEKPALILSSLPPPSVHLIAQKLSKWSGIKWVADFRDPWTDIYHYDSVKLSGWAARFNLSLEKRVLEKADSVITVSNGLARLFEKKVGLGGNLSIISNGYDESEMPKLKHDSAASSKFTMIYTGKLNFQQNPENLWQVLNKMINENKDFADNFQLSFFGQPDQLVIRSIQKSGIENCCHFNPVIPYSELLPKIAEAKLSLLLIPNTKNNLGIVTGKIFDYLGTGIRIFGIGPKNGDAAKILEECASGSMVEYDDAAAIEQELKRLFTFWQNGRSLTSEAKPDKIIQYSRRKGAERLAQVMDGLL
jgi:glycosyltransferase involved in cell wall biosynthesis